MSKKVVVIGGGIAGMESSAYLAAMGYDVVLLEKENELGGHLLKWEKLFPTRRSGNDVVKFLSRGIEQEKVKVITGANIEKIEKTSPGFKVHTGSKGVIDTDAVLVATGYDLFDAARKEEYGYGIYDDIVTSADLEKVFLEGSKIKTTSGNTPKRIGFVHCVGSRDERIGNNHCSQVCCITAIKQAVEVREKLPGTEVFCFYMDLRLWGRGYEEQYKEAQGEYGVNFIRGRVSEAAKDHKKGGIVLRVEDTLTGLPMKMNVDILVLMIGFEPSKGTKKIGEMLELEFGDDRFLKTEDEHTMTNVSNAPGVFITGACAGPKCITNTITDARAAAAKVASYLEGYDIEERISERHKK